MIMGPNDGPKRRRATKTQRILKLQKQKDKEFKYTQAVYWGHAF